MADLYLVVWLIVALVAFALGIAVGRLLELDRFWQHTPPRRRWEKIDAEVARWRN